MVVVPQEKNICAAGWQDKQAGYRKNKMINLCGHMFYAVRIQNEISLRGNI